MVRDLHAKHNCHRLSICWDAKLLAQRKRKMGEERCQAVWQEVSKLMAAQFIREVDYTTRLSNVFMVKKPNGKWRMCTHYTDLNWACPKDAYPFLYINRLVNGATEHKMLSFLYAYLGYNQIRMDPLDEDKIAFITKLENYYYKVMSFWLKNAGATHQ